MKILQTSQKLIDSFLEVSKLCYAHYLAENCTLCGFSKTENSFGIELKLNTEYTFDITYITYEKGIFCFMVGVEYENEVIPLTKSENELMDKINKILNNNKFLFKKPRNI